MIIFHDTQALVSTCLCINDVIGSLSYWIKWQGSLAHRWNFTYLFTDYSSSVLLYYPSDLYPVSIDDCNSIISNALLSNVSVLDMNFIQEINDSIINWIGHVCDVLAHTILL